MESFKANDGVMLHYIDTGASNDAAREKPWLILIHGFTGSAQVWKKNVPAFSNSYRVIVPDLRGHGESDKRKHGYHVSRLAMDLNQLVSHLESSEVEGQSKNWKAIGGSLGCSILWCYAELFTTTPFTHMIFVDQSPLQNTLPDWDSRFCNRGMNNPTAVITLKNTLRTHPEAAHKGTIAACLSYRAFPRPTDRISKEQSDADEAFFLGEAMKGNNEWYGKLMANHTSLDWRDSIRANFGIGSGSKTKVFVIASNRSGCFPAAGPLHVVTLIEKGRKEAGETEPLARGIAIDWGGHWCYWENPEKFMGLCEDFLKDPEVVG